MVKGRGLDGMASRFMLLALRISKEKAQFLSSRLEYRASWGTEPNVKIQLAA